MAARARPRKILAIDWDSRTLRVVHAVFAKRGVHVDRLFSVPIPDSTDRADPSQMGRFIRRALDQEGITTAHATVDIPRDQAILNTLSLPGAAGEELPGMVRIQVAKELPFPVADAVVDFTVSSQPVESVTAEVLVAAVRREVLEQYEATCTAAGLKLDRIGLRPYANMVAVRELLHHAVPERVMYVDVRPALTEIGILHHGALAFSRAASVTIPPPRAASSALSIADDRAEPTSGGANEGSIRLLGVASSLALTETIQPLLVEVTRSIEAYRARDAGARIDHAVIAGDLGVEEMLATALQERLHLTTEIYNPASSFGWEPDEGAEASAFAASLGLVLSHAAEGDEHFDFLHPKRTESAVEKRLKKAPLVAAVAVLFLVAAGVLIAGVTKPDRDQLARMERSIGELQAHRLDNKKFLKVVEQIRAFDGDQLVWVDVLRDVLSVLPSNEQLLVERVDMNQKARTISLKTRTKHRETATEVVGLLRRFRREGKTRPRFRAGIGPQSKKVRKYPYAQKFTIEVLSDDGVPGRGKKPARSRRS